MAGNYSTWKQNEQNESNEPAADFGAGMVLPPLPLTPAGGDHKNALREQISRCSR